MSAITNAGPGGEDALESLMRNAREGVFVLNEKREFVAFSEGCERITGFAKSVVTGQGCRCHDTMNCHDEHGRSLAGALCPGLEVFHGEAPARAQLMRICRADGEQVWVETTYSPMHDQAGRTIGVIGVMRPAAGPGDVHARTSQVLLHASTPISIGVDPRHPSPILSAGEADSDGGALDGILLDVERQQILAALRRAHGQRAKAARSLGISRSRLYRRMDVLGIDPRAAD